MVAEGQTTVGSPAVGMPDNSVYIGGRWMASPDGGAIDVVNPATEEVIGCVPQSSAELGLEALNAAREALPDWAARSPESRVAFLRDFADALEANGEQLATLASTEIGMPIRESRAVQVSLPANVLRSTADLACDLAWDTRDASGSSIVREPVGVVLGITPWNFPVHQIIAKLAPALASGCTLVLKPAELTPLNAIFLASLCDQVGIPAGVVNVVTGTGAATGEALVRSGAYDSISFTGSLKIGRHIGAIAGERIVRATLELGGKSPAVVLDDADLAKAVRTTVQNCLTNAGQKCNAPTRLIVPEPRRTEAAEIAAEAAEAYVLGDPLEESTTMGPLVSEIQRQKVLGFLDGTGGRLLTGGRATEFDRGYFVRPAVVTDLDDDDPVVRDEIFGPVLAVLGHDGDDDAVRRANDTDYGLSAELWSSDPTRARAVARRMEAGQVRVNGVRTPALPVSPFGGYKASGLGREMGPFALEEYLEIKAILGDPEGDQQ